MKVCFTKVSNSITVQLRGATGVTLHSASTMYDNKQIALRGNFADNRVDLVGHGMFLCYERRTLS